MAQGNWRSADGLLILWVLRPDFPQFGWIAKPVLTGTNHLYEATTDYGWFVETQAYRPYERRTNFGPRAQSTRVFYESQPQQGWMAKPVLVGGSALYEAATGYGWYSQTQAYRGYEKIITYGPRVKTNRVFYESQPQQGWLAKPVLAGGSALYEAKTGYGWYPETQTYRVSTRAVTSRTDKYQFQWNTTFDLAWIFKNLTTTFDPAIQAWWIDGQRPLLVRKADQTQPSFGWIVGFTYNAWLIDGQRPLRLLKADQTQPSFGWIGTPNLTLYEASVGFGWRSEVHSFDAQPKIKRWLSEQPVFDWLYQSILLDPVISPAFRIQADRPQKVQSKMTSAYPDVSWLTSALAVSFNPALMNWTISSPTYNGRPRRVDSTFDLSWITSNLPAPFNVALFSGIAQLVSTRTTRPSFIQVQYELTWLDPGFVHDAIPLDVIIPRSKFPIQEDVLNPPYITWAIYERPPVNQAKEDAKQAAQDAARNYSKNPT